MTLRAIGKYLLFDRAAIVALARDERAPWLGLLFVLGAGLAREYDKENLLAEPWHVLLPLGASLIAAMALYAVLSLTIFFKRPGRPGWVTFFPRFLGLFWLTAPLAWSYAVPYEQFLSEADAAYANLITLAIVAAWRVALTVRVVGVLYGVPSRVALWPVMLFAVGAAFGALSQLDARLLALMGGVRLSEAEKVLRSGAFLLAIGSFYSSWVWLLGTLVVLISNLVKPSAFPPFPELTRSSDRGPWILGGVVCGALLLALPLTQRSQLKRHRVERLLAAGDYGAGLDLLCATPQGDFPAHWEPPPRTHRGLRGFAGHPDLLKLAHDLAQREQVPEWVMASYSNSLGEFTTHELRWTTGDAERTQELLHTLLTWPDRGLFRPDVVDALLEELGQWELPELESKRTEEIALLKQVLARVDSRR